MPHEIIFLKSKTSLEKRTEKKKIINLKQFEGLKVDFDDN